MRKRPRECILLCLFPMRQPRGKSWALSTVSATCAPSASRRRPRMLRASSAEVLWCGAEAARVADAVIEAARLHARQSWLRYTGDADTDRTHGQSPAPGGAPDAVCVLHQVSRCDEVTAGNTISLAKR